MYRQSPIKINSDNALKINDKDCIKYNYNPNISYEIQKKGNMKIISDYNMNMEFINNKYDFIEGHFHYPGEHIIDDKNYDMEFHIVHKLKFKTAYLVVGIMLEIEEGDNVFDKILQNDKKQINIDFNKLIPNSGFYTYAGSLTTPKYAECVQWVIYKDYMKISQKSYDKYVKQYNSNARECKDNSNCILFELL